MITAVSAVQSDTKLMNGIFIVSKYPQFKL